MTGMISAEIFTFVKSSEAELGSAEEQPNRNNLTDWNGQGREDLLSSPFSFDHSGHLSLKKLIISSGNYV
jgi:hypothetical protein